MHRYGVIGATSWGLTLAWLLERNGSEVTVACRTEAEAMHLAEHRSLRRLPGLELPPSIAVATAERTGDVDGYVVAVPAQSVGATMRHPAWSRSAPVLCAAKGIENETGLRLSQVIARERWRPGIVAALSGPNLSHEVIRGLPAASVVACQDQDAARRWQGALSSETFRVYTSSDVVGVETGGALKNVVAIAAGAADGLGFGTNAVASLMTRGLAEITRLGVALGADPLTFQGLAGVGDLAATCFSRLSRNHRLGELLARGISPQAALVTIGEAVEGAATAPVAAALAARHRVEMPITASVAAVLDGRIGIGEAVNSLLRRPVGAESLRPA